MHISDMWSSLCTVEGINSTVSIFNWIESLNTNLSVDIHKTTLAMTKWFYDYEKGQIVNKDRSFFQISGIHTDQIEQPIIIQNEIGYLGLLCKPINGVIHFLMQAKVEPGNINKIQLSPTLQATKSNFLQAHGGVKPAYLDVFLNAEECNIVYDQIQSEQSSRFLSKRNRNIVVMLSENAKVQESEYHRWLTLGQIKHLMHFDNIVNMDTRTVIGCMPIAKSGHNPNNNPFVHSILHGHQHGIIQRIFQYMNNCKMFADNMPFLVPLYSMRNWVNNEYSEYEEFVCKSSYPFKLIYCDISIEGREVRHWSQPLLETLGMATFGLLTRVNQNVQEFLVHAKKEVGCFDIVELAPTIQFEATEEPANDIEKIFYERYIKEQGIEYDVILSEEGGRFYHEQNRNVIIKIEPELIDETPPGYWWCTYMTLSNFMQINNILNIQLRNLLALLEIKE